MLLVAFTSKTQCSSLSRPGTPLGRGVAWRKLATLATSNGSCGPAFSSALAPSHLVASPVHPPLTSAWCPWRRPLLPAEGGTWWPVDNVRRPWYRPLACRLKGIAFCASRLALASPAIALPRPFLPCYRANSMSINCSASPATAVNNTTTPLSTSSSTRTS